MSALTASAEDVMAWTANRLGADLEDVPLNGMVIGNFNRNHPDRKYENAGTGHGIYMDTLPANWRSSKP